MVMRNKTTNIYTEWLPLIDSLPNDIAGVIFKNILKYQNGDDINNTFPVWVFIKSKIDEYNNKGLQISEKRRESGRNGGLAKASKCQQMLANDSKSSNKIKENKTKQNKIKENNYIYSEYFEKFWELYTPIAAKDGRFVAKGNKKACQEKFNKITNEGVNYETIINGLKQYLTYCRENGVCSCGAEVFLNQRRWENDYTGSCTIPSSNTTRSNRQSTNVIAEAWEFARDA